MKVGQFLNLSWEILDDCFLCQKQIEDLWKILDQKKDGQKSIKFLQILANFGEEDQNVTRGEMQNVNLRIKVLVELDLAI